MAHDDCVGQPVQGTPLRARVLALSVILTPMFNQSGGSLLVAVLFHAQVNGPAWPEAQPWENYPFAAIAVIVVLLNRRTMLHRGNDGPRPEAQQIEAG